ncbi:MAG: hypothetical protein ACJARF_000300 [Alteromonadaceae bacterium]|jgi:hypothetical protein
MILNVEVEGGLRVKISSRLTNPNAENIYRLLENKKGPEGPFLVSKATYSEAAFLSVLS